MSCVAVISGARSGIEIWAVDFQEIIKIVATRYQILEI